MRSPATTARRPAPARTVYSTTHPPLPLRPWLSRPRRAALPFPLDDASCRLFARARHGLFHGVRALGLRAGDEVLVPAYHHGSEVESLVAAGLVPRLYDATPTLEPPTEELESLLTPRVRALHLTHYLGWPQDTSRWRAWCDARGLLLLEDGAQAWMARSGKHAVGELGDLAIFSLYKTVPIPDGGALIVRGEAPHQPAAGGRGVRLTLALHLAAGAQRSPALARLEAATDRSGAYDSVRDFALGDPSRAPTRATRALLPRVADPAIPARRREHARRLLAALGDRVPPPFDAVPDGASPYALPVRTQDVGGLIGRLRRRGVQGVHLWRQPHPAAGTAYPAASARRRTTVIVPVHQALHDVDLDRIADALDRAP